MEMNVGKEVSGLLRMTVTQLRRKYAEVFGEETNGRNKAWLVKRIAWRLQARAEGGLSERARRRAEELANDADIRMNPPLTKVTPTPQVNAEVSSPFAADDRLPPPDTVLIRKYKGVNLQVKVLREGFEYEGESYSSLSAVAKRITGSHCNGFLFFRLDRQGGTQ